MTREFKFDIGQTVIITAISNPARVIGYKLDGKNTYVQVSYWLDGKIFDIYLDEDECVPQKKMEEHHGRIK